MKFLADNKESVTIFSTLCKNYANYEWAVAWAGEVNGFDLANILSANEGRIRKLVVGLHFYQTAPTFIRRFMSNKQVHFILQSDGTFHSKVYLFYNSSLDWAAVVGSMNFTTSAFHRNSEVGIYISSKDASSEIFNQIKNYIASVWGMGKCFTDKELEVYQEAFAYQSDKIASLSKFESSKGKMVTSSLNLMTWSQYYQAILNHEKEVDITQRLQLLDEANALFKRYKHFADMPDNIRKCLAGVEKTMRSKSLVRDWKWFGSMSANLKYYGEVIKGDGIGKAIDGIPLEGLVSKEQFDEYCEFFYKKWKKNPIGCATRLLAIKRPDLFVCIDSQNRAEIKKKLNCPEADITLANYWNVILKRLYESAWYKDNSTLDGIEALVKKCRVAMLDAICYQQKADGTEMNETQESWLLPYNENKFRFMDWLETHDYVFWRQKVNLNPGDIVYIYGSAPIRAIVCVLQVDSVDHPEYASGEEKQYWVSPDSLTTSKKYAKLNVLAIPEDREALSFDNLHDHGLKVPPQGGIKLRGDLKDYINSMFE